MQTIQSATQLELDRIVDEIASLWKMNYVVCAGIIREYLVKAGVVKATDDEKVAVTLIPSPVLTMPDLTVPTAQEVVEETIVLSTSPISTGVSEKFMEAITAAVEFVLPIPELVEEQVAVAVEVAPVEDPRPCIPNVPLPADPTEKTTKSEIIRQMFDQGISVGKISRDLKSNYSYVWAVVDTYKAVLARQKAESAEATVKGDASGC